MSEAADFITLALAGEVVSDEIDDFVAAWHESDAESELHTFLGMKWEEYQLWVSDPAYLSIILAARHNGQKLREAVKAVNDNYRDGSLMAARGGRADRIMQLDTWLSQNV